MKEINKLANLFAEYRIYPREKYGNRSAISVFHNMYPDNYYSEASRFLIDKQNYNPEQRGADLPWWGKKYFSTKKGYRVMVVSQDSLAEDAGSVVFAGQFLSEDMGQNHYSDIYKEYTKRMGTKYFSPNKLKKVFEQFKGWNIDSDFLYLTDASKVYKNNSWKDRDFDKERSKDLLNAEIDLCGSDAIILLGAQPLILLDKKINYSSSVEAGKLVTIGKNKCIVAPFFIGNGPSGNRWGLGFKKRLEIATKLIKQCRT
jgi:hypothetical protein